jgi:hypothetical protein
MHELVGVMQNVWDIKHTIRMLGQLVVQGHGG